MQVSLLEVIQDVHIQPKEYQTVRKATLRTVWQGRAKHYSLHVSGVPARLLLIRRRGFS